MLLPALQQDHALRGGDFTYIGLLELNPVVCVVHPDSGYKTLDDLAKAVKAKPGKLNYSHSGPATVQNLAPQLLLSTLGLKPDAVVSVPYKGGNEVALAVLSRDVDFACNNLSSMTGLLTGGKLRPLLTTTPERLAQFPDIPGARAGAAADGSGDRLERPVRAAEDGARGGAAMGGGAQADRAGSEVDRGE